MSLYTELEGGGNAGSSNAIMGSEGAAIAAASSITVTHPVHKITGAGTVNTISGARICELILLKSQDGFTLGTSGNIRRNTAATTANKAYALWYDGEYWYEIGAAAVTSLSASAIVNTPAGNIAATDVQAALNELDSEKVKKAGDVMTGALSFLGLNARNILVQYSQGIECVLADGTTVHDLIYMSGIADTFLNSGGGTYITRNGSVRAWFADRGLALTRSNGDNAWFGSGDGNILAIQNAVTAPSANPTGGMVIWSEGGAGKARGSSGTVTTFAPAEPHCPQCGRDFMHEWENASYGYLAVCMWCLTDELGARPYIIKEN